MKQRRKMLYLLFRLQYFKHDDGLLWFHFCDISEEYETYKALLDQGMIEYTGRKEDLPRHLFPNTAYRITQKGNWVLTNGSAWVYDALTSNEELETWRSAHGLSNEKLTTQTEP